MWKNITRMTTGAIVILVAMSSTGCPPAGSATLRVWNTTGKTIVEVYCTPITSDTWGENLIVGSIAPGETLDITGFTPDNYDVLAVFADDTEAEEDDIALVADSTYTWNVLLSLPSGKTDAAPVGAGL